MFTFIGIDIVECSKSLKMFTSDDKPDFYKFSQNIAMLLRLLMIDISL